VWRGDEIHIYNHIKMNHVTGFYHLSCFYFQPAIKKGRDINYLMICLLALPPQGETTERCRVVVLVPHFFWKHFLFETVDAFELGIAS
jgi:hypothetical protein